MTHYWTVLTALPYAVVSFSSCPVINPEKDVSPLHSPENRLGFGMLFLQYCKNNILVRIFSLSLGQLLVTFFVDTAHGRQHLCHSPGHPLTLRKVPDSTFCHFLCGHCTWTATFVSFSRTSTDFKKSTRFNILSLSLWTLHMDGNICVLLEDIH